MLADDTMLGIETELEPKFFDTEEELLRELVMELEFGSMANLEESELIVTISAPPSRLPTLLGSTTS